MSGNGRTSDPTPLRQRQRLIRRRFANAERHRRDESAGSLDQHTILDTEDPSTHFSSLTMKDYYRQRPGPYPCNDVIVGAEGFEPSLGTV